MRHIIVTPYRFEQVTFDPGNGRFDQREVEMDARLGLRYLVQESMGNRTPMEGMALLGIFEALGDAEIKAVWLEDSEWELLADVVRSAHRLGAVWMPLVRRVLDAEEGDIRAVATS